MATKAIPKQLREKIDLIRRPGSFNKMIIVYNIDDDEKKLIAKTVNNPVIFNKNEATTNSQIGMKLREVTNQQGLQTFDNTLVALNEKFKRDYTIIVNDAEHLHNEAYKILFDFTENKVPVILLSNDDMFEKRLRRQQFYNEKTFFEADFRQLVN